MRTFLGSLPEFKRHSESLSHCEGYCLGLLEGDTREREGLVMGIKVTTATCMSGHGKWTQNKNRNWPHT